MSAWARAGVSKEVWDAFMADLNELNTRYASDIDSAGQQDRASDAANLQALFEAGASQEDLAEAARSSTTTSARFANDYTSEFQSLVQQYNIPTQIEDDGKIYYLDPGMFAYQAHPDGRLTNQGNAGSWVRDSRTDSYGWSDFAKDAITGVFTSVVGSNLPGLLSSAGVSDSAIGAINTAQDINSAYNTVDNITDQFWGGDPSQGHMPGAQQEEPWLDGLLGNGGLSIPIPGLPFPIPGNMSWEDLVEIARNSGRTIQEVIDSIGSDSSGGTPDAPPPQTVEEGGDTIGGVGLPGLLGRDGSDPVGESEEEDLSLGQPIWWEGGSLPGIPAPVDIPDDSSTPDPQPPSLVPGETGGTPDNPGAAPGNSSTNSALVLGLLPFLLPDNDPAPTPEFELWDYIGADTSWGIDRPDYGTVEQGSPYQFAKQPSQPTQVGYSPEPRRDYLSVLQQEQLRRQQRGLL